MKINKKKKQEPLFKARAIVEYFRQPPVVLYADNMPYYTIGKIRIFGKYKVVRAEIAINKNTREYKYNWHHCKVVKISERKNYDRSIGQNSR